MNAVPSPAPATRLGYFDRLGETSLTGWAVDSAAPGRPVALDVWVDGEWLCTFNTRTSRSDVSASGRDGAVAGFTLWFTPGLFGHGAQVDIRFAGTETSLKRSPRTAKKPGTRATSGRYMDAVRADAIRPVTIVVPIFNAFECVVDCLAAASRNVGADRQLLIVDDASTDPRVGELLRQYERLPDVRVISNPANLGYTRTANLALSACDGRDVVLLNSDTIVTGHWLESLRYCAYAFGRVATVTPLSNNAGTFSVPEVGMENHPSPGATLECHARAIVNAGTGMELDVPTGNGFCLYMRRDGIDALGGFDEAKFPRGYGEENEFCMRALRAGWRHLVSDKALVFHKRSQSFLGDRGSLLKAGLATLDAEFPEYRRLISRFNDLDFCMVRKRARAAVAELQRKPANRRILFVISTEIGGTPQTNMDLMRAISTQYECFLLKSNASLLTLSRLRDGHLEDVETLQLKRRIDPLLHASDEYDNHVADLLYRHSIDLLHIRHMAWHGLGLVDAAKAMSIPIVYSLHDFYAVCPTVKLLDQDQKFCGGTCTPGPGDCRIALWKQHEIPNLKHGFIGRWRENHARCLEKVDAFVTTADFVADLFASNFRSINRDAIAVIPHGRDFPALGILSGLPDPGEKLRVLVLGNISAAKGATLIRSMIENGAENYVEFHFLGAVAPELTGSGVQHGVYDRDDVVQKIGKIAPHVGVVLSIWPETHCHTLTEMWAAGVPVLGIDTGAVGERIAASGAGWLVPDSATVDDVSRSFLAIRTNAPEYKRKIAAVAQWQKEVALQCDCLKMARGYTKIYGDLLGAT